MQITTEELAKLSGITKRMVAYYETEAVKPPIDKVESLAKALNVNINELLTNKEPTKIQNEFYQLDGRTLKKIKSILSLPPEDRHLVYSFVDSLLMKRQLQDSKK